MTDVITKAVEGSNLIPFSFEGSEVRALNQVGEPWWVLSDVCKVLEIRNSRDAADRLDDDEKGVATTDTLGGPQEMTIINESGLWSLVLTSRKPAAKRFKKWITAEVIPSIRKTGGYTMAAPETPEQLAVRALAGLQSVVDKQKAQLAVAAPKAAALDRISTADGSYGLTEAAKILQVKPKALIAFMATSQWIYRRNNAKNWLAYQAKIDAGYLWHKIGTYTDPNGEEKTRDTVKVLPKGLAKLAQIVPGAKIDPDLMQMDQCATVARRSAAMEYVPLDTTERQQERLTTKASFITTDMILMTAMDRWEAMRWSGVPQSQEDADMWYEINDYTPKTPYAHKRKERFLGLFPHTAIKRSTIPA